jgi:magnesium chelatase family protein
LDRIDLHVPVQSIPVSALHQAEGGESSAIVAIRVAATYERQLKRQGRANAQLGSKDIEQYCALDKKAQLLLNQSMEALKLSARAYHRILKVARTIADLAGEPAILPSHIGEALSYRNLDRSVVDA